MSDRRGAMGRSWHSGAKDLRPGAVNLGLCFEEQWQRALKEAPALIFVTGWNEWVATRNMHWDGFGDGLSYSDKTCYFAGGLFVDQYDQEYSRDCEPMKGGHGDNYYYQLVSWVRRYKGVRNMPCSFGNRRVVLGADDWAGVGPEYRDTAGDTIHRDHNGYGGVHYTNSTGRNDILLSKVSYDKGNIYFMVEAATALTPYTDPNWMILLIDADLDCNTGWYGYDVRVNGVVFSKDTSSIEKYRNGEWISVGETQLLIDSKRLELALKRKIICPEETLPVAFDFHWLDNIQTTNGVSEFGLFGDSAPNRRFNYRFVGTESEISAEKGKR